MKIKQAATEESTPMTDTVRKNWAKKIAAIKGLKRLGAKADNIEVSSKQIQVKLSGTVEWFDATKYGIQDDLEDLGIEAEFEGFSATKNMLVLTFSVSKI